MRRAYFVQKYKLIRLVGQEIWGSLLIKYSTPYVLFYKKRFRNVCNNLIVEYERKYLFDFKNQYKNNFRSLLYARLGRFKKEWGLSYHQPYNLVSHWFKNTDSVKGRRFMHFNSLFESASWLGYSAVLFFLFRNWGKQPRAGAGLSFKRKPEARGRIKNTLSDRRSLRSLLNKNPILKARVTKLFSLRQYSNLPGVVLNNPLNKGRALKKSPVFFRRTPSKYILASQRRVGKNKTKQGRSGLNVWLHKLVSAMRSVKGNKCTVPKPFAITHLLKAVVNTYSPSPSKFPNVSFKYVCKNHCFNLESDLHSFDYRVLLNYSQSLFVFNNWFKKDALEGGLFNIPSSLNYGAIEPKAFWVFNFVDSIQTSEIALSNWNRNRISRAYFLHLDLFFHHHYFSRLGWIRYRLQNRKNVLLELNYSTKKTRFGDYEDGFRIPSFSPISSKNRTKKQFRLLNFYRYQTFYGIFELDRFKKEYHSLKTTGFKHNLFLKYLECRLLFLLNMLGVFPSMYFALHFLLHKNFVFNGRIESNPNRCLGLGDTLAIPKYYYWRAINTLVFRVMHQRLLVNMPAHMEVNYVTLSAMLVAFPIKQTTFPFSSTFSTFDFSAVRRSLI